jgi:hypothetical protein
MNKKSGKKGKQQPSRQEQQGAAARRRSVAGGGRTRPPAPSRTHELTPVIQETRGADPRERQSTRYYLDVSAARIQEWLARTPDLKFRRGGSIMLSGATGRDAWETRLPQGTEWNTEAGDLDGVVSLIAKESMTGTEAVDCLVSAAREVALTLRRALPYCPIQAVAGTGRSYAEAYQEIDLARRDGDFLVDSAPPPAELILAKPCDQCRAASAEHPGVQIAGPNRENEDLCGDCFERIFAAGGTKGDRPHRSPRPERRMKGALEAAGMPVLGFPDDFRQLAEAGRCDPHDAPTQLALIYADGNRVGAFLAEAAAYAGAHGFPPKSDIVRAVDDATLAALADAIRHALPRSQRPPVLAHVAGGDDLMISVAASHAWLFSRALLAAFGERIASAVSWPRQIRDSLPSLSAGIVFHHLSTPFSDVVRLASAELDKAKKTTSGRAPSVAFLDLTSDGGDAPPSREPLTLADLHGKAARLAEIAAIPRSHLQTLVALHRRCHEHGDAPSPSTRHETPVEALARRVVDLGYQPLWDVAAGSGADPRDVRSALVSSVAARTELRRTLDLARWWPPTSGVAVPAVPRPSGLVGEEVLA